MTATSATDSNNKTVIATCTNPGTKVLGGGVSTPPQPPPTCRRWRSGELPVLEYRLDRDGRRIQNVNATWTITVYVICAQA